MGGPSIAYFFQLLVNCDCVVSNMPRPEEKMKKLLAKWEDDEEQDEEEDEDW